MLVPSQVTMLCAPVSSVHWLPPPQDEVQFAPQEPEQVDWPSQVVVQLVPQLTEQVFFEAQLYVTLLGAAGAPSGTPASVPVAPSKVHVPPMAQLQTDPLQVHGPVQRTAPGGASELEHPKRLRVMTMLKMVGFTRGSGANR
jgi:hypothetical protein